MFLSAWWEPFASLNCTGNEETGKKEKKNHWTHRSQAYHTIKREDIETNRDSRTFHVFPRLYQLNHPSQQIPDIPDDEGRDPLTLDLPGRPSTHWITHSKWSQACQAIKNRISLRRSSGLLSKRVKKEPKWKMGANLRPWRHCAVVFRQGNSIKWTFCDMEWSPSSEKPFFLH